MATELRVLKELTPNIRGSFSRINEQMCFFNGYDKPRYFDRSARAGYLGLEAWNTEAYRPTGTTYAGGSMTEGLYYSCEMVPVDTRYASASGDYRMGNPTLPSTAVLTTAASKSVIFRLTDQHPQRNFTEYSGDAWYGENLPNNVTTLKSAWATIPNNFTITLDSVIIPIFQNFAGTGITTMDGMADYIQTIIRQKTGRAIIFKWILNYPNSGTSGIGYFEMRSDSTDRTNMLTPSDGPGYDIAYQMFKTAPSIWETTVNESPRLANEADEIWVYASQGSPTAALAEEGAKYYVGKFSNTVGLYGGAVSKNKALLITTDPTTSTNAIKRDNFQPPTLRHSCVMNNRIFGIVNVTESRGTATWDATNKVIQGKTYGPFTINTVTSLGDNLFRYAFSGAPDLSSVSAGQRATLIGCSESVNNVRITPVLAVDNTAKTIDIRNEYGTVTGTFGTALVYTTNFADGFVGARFRFEEDGVNQIYEIATIDVFNQTMTLLNNYGGVKVAGIYYKFFIETSDRLLWWCKEDDPNSWPSENTLQFEEDMTAVAPAGEYLATFSRNNVYTVNPRVPEEGFRKTHAVTGTISPFSIVSCETGVFFYDGKTIRQFDGLQSQDVTRRKVRVFCENIYETMQDQIHGVYMPNEQSIRWYVPYGSGAATNNFYIQYNVSTGFWWIGQCIDCSCAVMLNDKTDGSIDLYTGSSARFANKAFILRHGAVETDAIDAATTATFGTVTSNTPGSYEFTVDMAGLVISTNDVGVPFTIFSATGARAVSGMIKTLVDNGSGNYTITYHHDFNLADVQSGDWIAVGVPYFVWGIKWLDFGTPQYRHELKELHLDFTPVTYAYGIVDFYTDFNETPTKSVGFTVTSADNKAVIRYHGARGNQVGFRVRMWSKYLLEIRDMVVIHRSIV